MKRCTWCCRLTTQESANGKRERQGEKDRERERKRERDGFRQGRKIQQQVGATSGCNKWVQQVGAWYSNKWVHEVGAWEVGAWADSKQALCAHEVYRYTHIAHIHTFTYTYSFSAHIHKTHALILANLYIRIQTRIQACIDTRHAMMKQRLIYTSGARSLTHKWCHVS